RQKRCIASEALIVGKVGGLCSSRHVQAGRELAGEREITSPTAAEHSLAGAEQIVSRAETWLPIGGASGEAAHRYRRVAFSPQEAAILRRGATGAVLRVIENGIAEAKIVLPRSKVSDSQTDIQRQSLVHLPGILDESLKSVIRNIVDAIEIGFSIGV